MREEIRVTMNNLEKDLKKVRTELGINEHLLYEAFKKKMVEEYKARTSQELMINSVIKNNGTYESFVLKMDEAGISPNIYIQPLFEMYINRFYKEMEEKSLKEVDKLEAMSFETAYKQLTNIIESTQNQTPQMDLEFKLENLVLQVIGSENNKVIMEESPFRVIEGTNLICIYKWVIGENKNGVCSARITNKDIARYGLDKFSDDELYELALKNTQRLFPGVVRDMMEMLDMPFPDEIPEEDRMWVVTNEKGINGATSILYKGILEEVFEKIGGNFYIIPSSIHEIICISAKNRDAEPLKTLVGEVNGGLVENHERLSYNVYLYEVETDSIRIAA